MPWLLFSCGGLALTLLVAWIFANHHDATVSTNHLALVANLLDARVYLHDDLSSTYL